MATSLKTYLPFKVKDYLNGLIKVAFATKCISCEYVYGNIHPFIVICENYCYMCSICLKNMKGLDLFVTCPNKDCRGKFLSADVKKKIADPQFNDQLEEIYNINRSLEQNEPKLIKMLKIPYGDEDEYEDNMINDIIINDSLLLSPIIKEDDIYTESIATKNSTKKMQSPPQAKHKGYIDIPIIPLSRASVISTDEKIDATCNTSVASTLTCPNCRIAIELVSGGCNIVNCTSPIKCRGKFNFCKLCMKPLLSSNFSIHYPFGIYKSECVNYSKKKI